MVPVSHEETLAYKVLATVTTEIVTTVANIKNGI
jgi:hypothetical protein